MEQKPICDACETVAHCMKNGCIPQTMAGADLPVQMVGQEPEDPLTMARAAGNWLQDLCHGASVDAGWWHVLNTDEDLREQIKAGTRLGKALVAEKLCLVHSEISEAMEGHRKGLPDDKLPHRLMVEVELADAVIRIADLAGALGLDLGGAIAEKMAFNADRPDHKPEARAAAGGKSY